MGNKVVPYFEGNYKLQVLETQCSQKYLGFINMIWAT